MRVTGQEGYADSSVQGIVLKSLDERIAFRLEESPLKICSTARCKNEDHVVFGRPLINL